MLFAVRSPAFALRRCDKLSPSRTHVPSSPRRRTLGNGQHVMPVMQSSPPKLPLYLGNLVRDLRVLLLIPDQRRSQEVRVMQGPTT
jgi:hypothetical protein